METFHLLSGRALRIEVSHHANPDRFPVQGLARQMAAIELRGPAAADGDLAVLHRMAVANHKMVGQTVFHVALDPMIVVHPLDAGIGRGAVMNHNVFPLARLDPSFSELLRQT